MPTVEVTALNFKSLGNALAILITITVATALSQRYAIEIDSAREALVAIPWIMLCKYRTVGKAKEYAY